ncbi:MAG TPA: kelch repeat-containing protein [Kofleriaceae bacterium]|nr:kelch repeat-containing protein [Kofleriaceae bacterium]
MTRRIAAARASAPALATLAAALALAALAALAGCPSNELGTISLDLAAAPGSTLLDRVAQLRLTFTNPSQEIVLDRTDSGFDLVLDLDADGVVRSLIIDGFDAGGALVATGMSPPFPFAPIDARIVIYMAAPMSVGSAPAALDPPRARPSVAALTYGAVFAGGADAAGGPSDAVQIYNAYDHSLVTGRPMPDQRTGATLAVTARNGVFVFGGTGPAGTATGTLWFFDTTTAPAGNYVVLEEQPALARTGRAAVATGSDRFLIGGAPPLQLAAGKVAEATGIAAISSGASVTGSDQVTTAVVVEEATGELLRVRGGAPEPLGAQRKNGTAAALLGGRLAVFGGDAAPRDAVVVDAATGALTPVPGALAAGYATLAVAATPRFVVVAGVVAGATDTQVEILDADTLAPRLAAPLPVSDVITAAIALPNEQVLLVGAGLHLFTPPPPP